MKNRRLFLIAGAVIILALVLVFVLLPGGEEPDTPDDPGIGITDPGNTDPGIDDPGNEDPGNEAEYIEYTFRNQKRLKEHYYKHGVEMGFDSPEEYEKAASDVANNPDALHKLEKEDQDDVYYIEETNEFVVISKDGYIRTYFCPDSGKKYFDKQ